MYRCIYNMYIYICMCCLYPQLPLPVLTDAGYSPDIEKQESCRTQEYWACSKSVCCTHVHKYVYIDMHIYIYMWG